MIRVNLLPQASERRRAAPETGQVWMLVVMGIIVLEVVGLFFFHQTKEEELKSVIQNVARVDSQIKQIRALVKDHDEVRKALDVLRAREDAIAQLQAARKGPTAVLLELSKLLTPGKGPTLAPKEPGKKKVYNPLDTYNPQWDARRVWLQRYGESERSVRIEGFARDGGDVYEFAQRLRLSRYFDNIQLLPGKQEKKKAGEVDLVRFALQVKVKY